MNRPRLAIDVDGVLTDFVRHIFRVGEVHPDRQSEVVSYDFFDAFGIMKVWRGQGMAPAFWLTLPCIDRSIPKSAVAYVSNRPVDEWITESWLRMNNLPLLPVYHTKDKLITCREIGANGLVDDDPKNYELVRGELEYSFLSDRPWNRHVKNANRIYRLEQLEWRLPTEESYDD